MNVERSMLNVERSAAADAAVPLLAGTEELIRIFYCSIQTARRNAIKLEGPDER